LAEKEGNGVMVKGVQTVDVPIHWVNDGEKRLDAGFYAQDVIKARILIDKIKQSLKIQLVSDFSSKIFWPGRFKRHYVSKKRGKPFLMPSEVFMFLPKSTKYVINYPQDVAIKRDWLLISRSGTIGRTLIATKYLEDFVLSDDLIRIIPKESNNGYLYAYLNTWIGQALLTKDQYGVTVKHIEPHHVANIPIPRIPDLEERINQKILEAHKLREEAQELLLKAEEMIYSELGLSRIDEDDVEYFGGEIGKFVRAFGIKASDLDYRLDASYHVPIAHLVVSNLMKSGLGDIKKLKYVASSFVPPRFKRSYVKDPNDGIPLLQGTHIPQIKPLDIKYIWKKMKNLQCYIVNRNWILVTCSGTIGRLALVSDYWSGWAATNHLLRIMPKEEKINPGYLTGFLLSKYGQVQFQRLIYGGVVDEIGEAGELFDDILILKPKEKSVEDKIGSLVIEAYNKKDKANQIEEEAISQVAETLTEIAEME